MIIIKIILALVILLGIINLYIVLSPQFGGKPKTDRIQGLAKNSIYKDGKFQNQSDAPVMLPHSYGKVMKLQFQKAPDRTPNSPIPSVKPNHELLDEKLSITWFGHSTLLIRIDNKTLLTDPVFGKRASPFSFLGPKPFATKANLGIEDLPHIDAVLISHDHYDHLDYATIKQIHEGIPLFLVPLGIRDHLERWGVNPDKIIEFDWGTRFSLADSLQLTATPAQHFSGRKNQNNSTLWCSWVIEGRDSKVFFSGDSGYGKHFSKIGEEFGPFDLTLMECGAYGKYWPNIHMRPEESLQAHIDLRGKYLLPIHWGKYNLAFHPWKEPIQLLRSRAKLSGVTVLNPLQGEIYPIKDSLVVKL